ncbi:hypothetical protein TRFO_13647 [Tritrichomonas foetus]|uniref:Uncharacterized protein n=1 Tax=Tritrichomonas foetus TaxID=1144522 RepID=A0A1J4KXJ3_9EUKA|nr:hypothetical protein TRFO_13647 [Tritrichomonas foetus]|eukprot:OHT15959.1 hypothetical protein TRFO_13647 [Tritrichomonas foetus]
MAKHLSFRDIRELQLKQNKLLAELNKVNALYTKTQIEAFRVFNQTKNFECKVGEEYDELKLLEQQICEYLQCEPENMTEAYLKELHELNLNEKQKKEQLEKLKAALRTLDRDTENKSQITILGTFEQLKNQFVLLKDFYSNFKLEASRKIGVFKQAANKLIAMKKEKSLNKLNHFQDQVNQLEGQKKALTDNYNQKISRLSFEHFEDASLEFDQSKLQEMIQKYVETCQNFLNKQSIEIEHCIVSINVKFDDLGIKINNLFEKVKSYQKVVTEKKSNVVINNWGTLAYTLLKLERYSTAIDDFTNELNETEKELNAKLTHEKEFVEQKVPGTNMTILELRKEIVRLTRELSTETQQKHDELTSIEKEHQTFSKESAQMIHDLEVETNSLAKPQSS